MQCEFPCNKEGNAFIRGKSDAPTESGNQFLLYVTLVLFVQSKIKVLAKGVAGRFRGDLILDWPLLVTCWLLFTVYYYY